MGRVTRRLSPGFRRTRAKAASRRLNPAGPGSDTDLGVSIPDRLPILVTRRGHRPTTVFFRSTDRLERANRV